MEGVQSEIVGEAASCYVVVVGAGTNEQEWNGVGIVGILKETLISVSRNSDDYRARIIRDGG